jgi:hypothetical protein
LLEGGFHLLPLEFGESMFVVLFDHAVVTTSRCPDVLVTRQAVPLQRFIQRVPECAHNYLSEDEYLLSQAAFASLMGVSLRTVQDWEQARRKPGGPALALLRIADQKPEVFAELS